MPPPFPGMDPYLEGAAWEDFHGRYIAVLADALVPHLRPRYAVRTELRIYLEHPGGQSRRSVLPDLGVFRTTGSAPSAGATAVAGPPTVSLQLPVPEVQRERYLEIRNLSTGELATVIELLSPGNKRGGSEGRREFLGKRAAILSSPVHWVELDLLRGGERMPTVQPLPAADYYALV
ncbi:MAG: DUF4058 family protein, partial [SAR202 cluster bacterium]|nr:DUF4058 family protein [SAR202 cluster bacterium]